MATHCGDKPVEPAPCGPCSLPEPRCGSGQAADVPHAIGWFGNMVQHCYDYAVAQKEQGQKIVGILCEFTPREVIMAAGGIPVCLCGGSADTIPAAEEVLPANLCPLIKSTLGYDREKANPFLEMADLLVAETTCDGKKKMYEILAETRPMHVLELPQKSSESAAFDHWVRETERLKEVLEDRFNTTVADEALRNAIALMNRERALRRELAGLMASDAPPLTGSELLEMKSIIACIPEDLEQYQAALDMLPGRALKPAAQDRVRVLLTGVPIPHGAERVMTIIENSGGLVVCQENCTGLKPIMDDVDASTSDPLRAIAEKYFRLPCSVMTPNDRRFDLLRELTVKFRPQCIVEVIWQACITYDVESHYVRKLAEEDLHLPYLRIETDYSPSDSARIAMRVEALFETVRERAE